MVSACFPHAFRMLSAWFMPNVDGLQHARKCVYSSICVYMHMLLVCVVGSAWFPHACRMAFALLLGAVGVPMAVVGLIVTKLAPAVATSAFKKP